MAFDNKPAVLGFAEFDDGAQRLRHSDVRVKLNRLVMRQLAQEEVIGRPRGRSGHRRLIENRNIPANAIPQDIITTIGRRIWRGLQGKK